MRIWVIGRGVPSINNNLLGSFEFEQAQMLARKGHEVYYPEIDCRSVKHRRKFGYYEHEVDGVTVCTMSVPIGWVLRGSLFTSGYERCRRHAYDRMAATHGMPDIVHIHYPSLVSPIAFEYYSSIGVGIVGTEHWTKVLDKSLPKINQSYLKRHIMMSCAFVCVSPQLRKSVYDITRLATPIEVIPNIVPECYFNNRKKSNPNGTFRFLAVGRLVEVKNFELLIEAFSEAFRGNNRVLLDIVGEGECRSAIEAEIKKNSCDDRVRLRGAIGRDEMASVYAEHDALVMPSKLETFGVPVAEAMACGLPIITTTEFGAIDLINDSNGFVVGVDNKNQLISAMIRLFEKRNCYDSAAISSQAYECFSEKVIYAKLEKLYKQRIIRSKEERQATRIEL